VSLRISSPLSNRIPFLLGFQILRFHSRDAPNTHWSSPWGEGSKKNIGSVLMMETTAPSPGLLSADLHPLPIPKTRISWPVLEIWSLLQVPPPLQDWGGVCRRLAGLQVLDWMGVGERCLAAGVCGGGRGCPLPHPAPSQSLLPVFPVSTLDEGRNR
jgi:hypothetical protein